MEFDDPNRQINPYAPPSPDAQMMGGDPFEPGDLVLADRWVRLGARLLDGLLLFLTLLPALGFFVYSGFTAEMSRHRGSSGGMGALGSTELALFGVLSMVLMLPLVGYQWYLIAKTGQTLGKKWTGIRIVKMDGSPVDFVSGVILRNWVMAAAGFIPYLGSCVGLIDALMIFFNDERRCVHDFIAGTKVVVA
jgi:uncharacterized RDD family membrane protein YckC